MSTSDEKWQAALESLKQVKTKLVEAQLNLTKVCAQRDTLTKQVDSLLDWKTQMEMVTEPIFEFKHDEMKLGESKVRTVLRFAYERDSLKHELEKLQNTLKIDKETWDACDKAKDIIIEEWKSENEKLREDAKGLFEHTLKIGEDIKDQNSKLIEIVKLRDHEITHLNERIKRFEELNEMDACEVNRRDVNALKAKLYRAKEIIGAHIGDMSAVEVKLWEEL